MKLLHTTAILLLMTGTAYADNLTQNGAGHTAIQGSYNNNGNVNSGNTNSGNSTATANSTNTNTNVNANTNVNTNQQQQGQAQGQQQGQVQSASSGVSGSGNSSNSYSHKAAASSAIAAPLVAADDTCMGSSSGGAQGMGFGLSVGSTWRDSDCVRRKDARELHNMGHGAAALALLCQSAEVAVAMDTAGTPCPAKRGEVYADNDNRVIVSDQLRVTPANSYPDDPRAVKW